MKPRHEKSAMLRVEILGINESVPGTMTFSYNEDTAEPVKITLLPDIDMGWGHLIHRDDESSWFELRGNEYAYRDIYVSKFRYYGELKGTADLFIAGDLKPLSEPTGTFECYLTLPYNPLFTLRQAYGLPDKDREVKLWRDDEPTGIYWQTPLGKAELIGAYDLSPKKVVQRE